MHRLSASSTVFLLRDNHPREQGLEYLVGPVQKVMARIKGIQEYRQHHFDSSANLSGESLTSGSLLVFELPGQCCLTKMGMF